MDPAKIKKFKELVLQHARLQLYRTYFSTSLVPVPGAAVRYHSTVPASTSAFRVCVCVCVCVCVWGGVSSRVGFSLLFASFLCVRNGKTDRKTELVAFLYFLSFVCILR